MKKIKKKILVVLFIFVAAIIGISVGLHLSSIKSSNILTLEEREWIDTNKHNVIDIAVINEAPIISYDGEGLIYDYLNYVKEKTKLEFNIVPYKIGNDVDYKYKLNIVSKVGNDDIPIYNDKLIYISADNKEYFEEKDINNLKIGILKSEKEELNSYFVDKNIELVEFDDYDKLKTAIKEAKTNVEAGTPVTINGVIMLKTMYTKELVENNYKISYQFENLNRYFVLSIAENKYLNSIMVKEVKSWQNENYEKSYNEDLLNIYYKFKKITDVDEKKLKSKSYKYGFVNYGVINSLGKRKLKGFNDVLLKKFGEFSGISLSYTKYNSLDKIIDNYNNGNIDFILNIVDISKIKKESFYTIGAYSKQLVFISGYNNKDYISDISSLKGKEVLTIKNSNLESFLKENGVKTKLYNDIESLVKDFDSKNIALLDLENYDFYKSKDLKNSRISYVFNDKSKYNFIISDIDDNKKFEDLFNFYLMYNSIDNLIYSNYNDVVDESKDIIPILVIIIVILSLYIIIDFTRHMNKVFKAITLSRKTKMSKEDKMKYIDQLTSLKNRNYLNSKIEEWDESEVYPQSVIIVDLNNVSYINDNYGREEGDKVIKEAANILIQNQLENSEIIRTDGNEFLIFLVGYTEKQIISYLRKLSKEFKNLSHGFGAASGYSIITDAIKTFDDAVNEAVLDMKNNKEDIAY